MRSRLFHASVSLLLVAACTDPNTDDGIGSTDATEGDGDGDSGDGDGDGDSTGDGDGDGDTTGDGDGDGDGDTTGDGDGDADDPNCMGGDVDDSFEVQGLPFATTTQTCTVSEVNVLEPQYGLTLACTDGNMNFGVTIDFTASTVLSVPFPFAVDDQVTLESWFDDFVPYNLGYAIYDGIGDLRLAWVEGDGLAPPGADAAWSVPVQLQTGPGCTPDMNDISNQSIGANERGAMPINVYSSHSGVLSSELGIYELRVTQAIYNPNTEGGCNSCYTFALIG